MTYNFFSLFILKPACYSGFLLEIVMKYIESKNGMNFVYFNNAIVFTTNNFREAIDFMVGL